VDRMSVHVLGSYKGAVQQRVTVMRSSFRHRFSTQATTIWQWFRCLLAQVPHQQPVVTLNLDETSVRFFYPPKPGLKLKRKMLPVRSSQSKRHASKGYQRKAFTYVSIICDDKEMQAKLPQIVLIAEKMCSARDIEQTKATLPNNVLVWRQKSSWVNNDVFAQIVRLIGKSVKAAAPAAKPFLLMDARKVHYSVPVLRAAQAVGVTVLVIPASCTHLLQMLDTDVFARFKSNFRNRLHRCLSVGPNRDLPTATVLAELGNSIREVVQGNDWSGVFRKNGFDRSEPFARQSLLRELEWETLPALPLELPSYAAFCTVFPRGTVIPFDLLLKERTHQAARAPAVPAQTKSSPQTEDAASQSWVDRLRSRRPKPACCVPVLDSNQVASTSTESGLLPPLPPPPPTPPKSGRVPKLARLGPARSSSLLDLA
jgi:hypothetical protein